MDTEEVGHGHVTTMPLMNLISSSTELFWLHHSSVLTHLKGFWKSDIARR